MKSKKIICLILIQFFCIYFFVKAEVIIEGRIENIPSKKVYLTNRGYGSGPSFILKIFDSCLADINGRFHFKIKNIDESQTYSIEFSTIKIGWITLLPREDEHIKIKAVIKSRREIQSITGSSEYILQQSLWSIVNPCIEKMNLYADSSSFYYEINKDSANYYTRINKLYHDSINNMELKFVLNHPKSTYSLQLIDSKIFDLKKDSLKKILFNVDKSLKDLTLYKKLLQFANTNETLAIGNLLSDIEIIEVSGIKKSIDFSTYKGKVLIIDFWASWCVPCREKIPDLKLLYDTLDSKKYNIISISIDDNSQNWQKALEKEKMPWKNFIINSQVKYKILSKYSIQSIPKYILVNSQGKVILITGVFNELQNRLDLIRKDNLF